MARAPSQRATRGSPVILSERARTEPLARVESRCARPKDLSAGDALGAQTNGVPPGWVAPLLCDVVGT